jgi:hypothetical protein
MSRLTILTSKIKFRRRPWLWEAECISGTGVLFCQSLIQTERSEHRCLNSNWKQHQVIKKGRHCEDYLRHEGDPGCVAPGETMANAVVLTPSFAG